MRLMRIAAAAFVILVLGGTSALRVEARQCGTTCISGKQFDGHNEVFRLDSSAMALENYVIAATNAWSSAFENGGSGIRFTFNQSTTNSNAVTISVDSSVCPDWADASVNGNFIRICDTTLTTSYEFLQSTISHEIGHFTGLTATCPKQYSVMAEVQPNEMEGAVLLPGCSDFRSIDYYYPEDPPGTPDCSVWNGGGDYYEWNAQEGRCVPIMGSPIIVDIARNGYHLTNAADGVAFDLNADGRRERIAWTQAHSDDAFLCMDRNGNGMIDTGAELFGDNTPAYANRSDVVAPNGFAALDMLQDPSYGISTLDGQIDAADAAFNKLMLWTDVNHNGISEPEELQSLSQASVLAISTEYNVRRRVDGYGNEFRYQGWIGYLSGRGILYDVRLQRLPE